MRLKWFLRELERRERAWQTERAELVATICRLAGQPVQPTELDEWRAQQAKAAADRARAEREDEEDLVDYDQLPD